MPRDARKKPIYVQDRARIADACQMINDPSRNSLTIPAHVYEVRPRKDKRGVTLISDVLPFGPAVVLESRTRSAKQSATPAITAAHTMP
jgi:hypothetical protein